MLSVSYLIISQDVGLCNKNINRHQPRHVDNILN